MKTGTFIIEGSIGGINEKIFKNLKEIALLEEVSAGENAIEKASGIPMGVKVKNRLLTLNKEKDLLRAEVTYEMKL